MVTIDQLALSKTFPNIFDRNTTPESIWQGMHNGATKEQAHRRIRSRVSATVGSAPWSLFS
jgi:hypothetical protein